MLTREQEIESKNRLYNIINYVQMLKGSENMSFAIKELITKLKFHLTEYKTSYTDCIKNVYISYNHINLPAKQLAFIVCHEICHVLFIHGLRFKNLSDTDETSHYRWGIATDLFINTLLLNYCDSGSLEIPSIPKINKKTGKVENLKPLLFNKRPMNLNVEEIIYNSVGLKYNGESDLHHPGFNCDDDSIENNIDAKAIKDYIEKMINQPNNKRDLILERLQDIILPKHKNNWEKKLNGKLLKSFSSRYKSDYGRKDRRNTSIYFSPEYVKVKKPSPRFLFAIDSSGSISGEQLGLFKGEIIRVLKQGASCDLISCHTSIHDVVYNAKEKDVMNYNISETGGTFFDPVFDFANDNKQKYDYIVYLTDGLGLFNYNIYRKFTKNTIWLLNRGGCYGNESIKEHEDSFNSKFKNFGLTISID